MELEGYTRRSMTENVSEYQNEDRIKAVKGYYESGMRSGKVSPDTAPWVRRGLQILELGGDLTSDTLEKADKTQNMVLPKQG